MAEIAIKVERLGKCYQIGQTKSGDFRESFGNWLNKLKGNNSVASSSTNEFWALNDVNFEIKKGEAVGIIGRNGAGKSTLLKILSRITEPSKGRFEINGRVSSLLEVGTGFHPELSGRENIYLNGTILGMKRREIKTKFDEIVTFSGVEKFIDTPVKHYSSGMKVRLAFSVAAHLEPEILIIDEVLAVGDAEFQKKCLGKMDEVSKNEGKTILFVSHSMATVSTLCERGLLLAEGKVEYDGRADQTIDFYIRTQKDDKAEILWSDLNSAPGNDSVRITAIRVLSGGKVTSDVPINRDVVIEIEFYNKKAGARLSSNIQLFEKSGNGILSSVNWASATSNIDIYSNARFDKGYYRSLCTIPANFLNDKAYHINALILSDISNVVARADEAVSFTVHDTGEMRKEYTGGWLGLIRPKLEWQTFEMTDYQRTVNSELE